MNQCAPFLSGILKMIAYVICMVGLFILFFPADKEKHKWFVFVKIYSGVGLLIVALYLFFFC
nr:MAG TPA: hypothetical protein [Inoviridae sp.]